MFTVYFAGELFDHKHLTGNLLLADMLENLYPHTYQFILPQAFETLDRTTDVRDRDIASIIKADLVLCNFDGTDLDSGTVTEFVIAKMLDIPTVLLRTDFRHAGDATKKDADKWNLMCSGYPRTESVMLNSLALYRAGNLKSMHTTIARAVHEAFTRTMQSASVFNSEQEIHAIYKHIIKACGSNILTYCPEDSVLPIIQAKFTKNIYRLATTPILNQQELSYLR